MSDSSSLEMASLISLLGGEARQACAELLDRLELRRPARHLGEVLGVGHGRRRVGRECRQGLELLRVPRVRSVVMDGQHAEGTVLAAQERHRGKGVEPFLHHRGPERLRAWVVAVADREERVPGCHRLGRQRRERGFAGRSEVRGREPPTRLRAGRAVGPEQADRRPFRPEQAAGVLHDGGEDPVDVQLAGDVDRDPAERLGAMELQCGRLPQLVRMDGDRDRAGNCRNEHDPLRGQRVHPRRRRGGCPTVRRCHRGWQPPRDSPAGFPSRPASPSRPGRSRRQVPLHAGPGPAGPATPRAIPASPPRHPGPLARPAGRRDARGPRPGRGRHDRAGARRPRSPRRRCPRPARAGRRGASGSPSRAWSAPAPRASPARPRLVARSRWDGRKTRPPTCRPTSSRRRATSTPRSGARSASEAPGAAATLEPPEPLAGPILSLTGRPLAPGGALASREPNPPGETDLVARVLRQGEPADPRSGHADDFSWPRL